MADRICSIPGCEGTRLARALCSTHYQRLRKHGDPLAGARTRNTCSIAGCDGPCVGRGWCEKHYNRWKRHGDPLVTSRIVGDDVRRFESYLSLGPIPEHAPELGECWIWTGGLDPDGYCKFRAPGEQFAYRWAYTHHIGPIPSGLELDHLCRVRACTNPWHLDPVTPTVNRQRANSIRWEVSA